MLTGTEFLLGLVLHSGTSKPSKCLQPIGWCSNLEICVLWYAMEIRRTRRIPILLRTSPQLSALVPSPPAALAMNGAERRIYYCNALPASHTLVSLHPWPCVTFTLLVVAGWSTSQPGVFVMTAYRALIRPSGEDAMGRSCIVDSHPGRWMPAAVRMPAVVWMPACHSRRFKGERPIGAATG